MVWRHVGQLQDPLPGQCPILLPGSAHPRMPRELALLNCVSSAKLCKNPCCRHNRNHHPSQTLAKGQFPEGQLPEAPDTATLKSGQKGKTTKSDR